MKLSALLAKPDKRQVWAALCIAHADGTDARYRAEAKHATLVMVCALVRSREQSRGIVGGEWLERIDPQEFKALEQTVHQ
jgi:hypothetical protein